MAGKTRTKGEHEIEEKVSPSAAIGGSRQMHHDVLWLELYGELLDFYEKNGDCSVPSDYVRNPRLGNWVRTQRAQYKLFQDGKACNMTKDRIDLLEKIGFQWKIRGDWNKRYEELREYATKNGNCLVPTNYQPNPSLGRWVDRQRTQYKLFVAGKPSGMTQTRVDMLDEIEFQWKVRDDWEDRYHELEEYFNYHGDALVPARYAQNPSLAKWVDTQRQQYKMFIQGKPSSMTKERVAMLKQVNFQWKLIEDWIQRFRELEEYVKTNGDSLVPQHYAQNPSLGIWVRNQRTQYKLHREGRFSKLSQDRIKMLESLNFEWNAYEAKWMACFVELGRYVQEHGIGRLPSYQENRSLRCWAEEQRKQYKKWLQASLQENEVAALPDNGADQQAEVDPPNDDQQQGSSTSGGTARIKRKQKCASSSRLTTKRRELLELLGFPWPSLRRHPRGRPLSSSSNHDAAAVRAYLIIPDGNTKKRPTLDLPALTEDSISSTASNESSSISFAELSCKRQRIEDDQRP